MLRRYEAVNGRIRTTLGGRDYSTLDAFGLLQAMTRLHDEDMRRGDKPAAESMARLMEDVSDAIQTAFTQTALPKVA